MKTLKKIEVKYQRLFILLDLDWHGYLALIKLKK
jgi:hypothetical protein